MKKIIEEKTIFEKIINRTISAEIIYETEECIVIKDIQPQAPIHFLIIPKKFFINLCNAEESDFLFGKTAFRVAQYLSKSIKGAEEFRLIMNNGKTQGQSVFHAHIHFMAG